MQLKHRMSDLEDLEKKILQDLFSMLAELFYDNWPKALHDFLLKEQKYSNQTYSSNLVKMNGIGVDNYSSAYMDVTFITSILTDKDWLPTKDDKNTCNTYYGFQNDINNLRQDRNQPSHIAEVDENEATYRQACVLIENLYRLLSNVDKKLVKVALETRNTFHYTYNQKLNKMQSEFISDYDDYRHKLDIKKDIQKIINEGDTADAYHKYAFKYRDPKTSNKEIYIEFLNIASDAGEKYAKESLGFYYYLSAKNTSDYDMARILFEDAFDILDQTSKIFLMNIYSQGLSSAKVNTNRVNEILKTMPENLTIKQVATDRGTKYFIQPHKWEPTQEERNFLESLHRK